ncbi:MAG: hypothetical protein ACE5JN_12335 [Candidatus Methylomirabilia bacterium]
MVAVKGGLFAVPWRGMTSCGEQKTRFGPAAKLLPYVECDPRGVGARPDLRARIGVRRYPTWIIAGQRYEGVLSLGRLAEISGLASRRPR